MPNKPKVAQPLYRSPLRLWLGREYFIFKRYCRWLFGGTNWARPQKQPETPHLVFRHHSPVLRPLQAQTQGRALKLLDAGSGGGLPGVALAICRPELDVTCVDAVAKKAAFIQQAAATLKLPNLRGLHARVESLGGPFDLITSRAFASLADFTAWSTQALAPHGVWMAMKGKLPDEEIAALPPDVEVFHVEHLTVPGLNAERCIIWLRKRAGQ